MNDRNDVSESEVLAFSEKLNREAEEGGYHLNPDAKYEITLVTVPQLNNNVIIKTVSINGHSQDSVATAEMIRSLDMSFSGKR